ncbi:MAG: RDD family protein [Candidatus Binatia bacterium]
MDEGIVTAPLAETLSAEEARIGPPASLGDRLLGQAVDGLIALGLFFLFGMLLAGRFGGTTEQGFELTGLPALILLSILTVVMFLYFVLAEAFFGTTLGKVVAEVQVRDREGRPIGMKASVIRNVMRVVDGLPGFYLLGAFSVLLTRHNVRLGDITAGTVVIKREHGRMVRAAFLVLALVLAAAGIWAGYAFREAPAQTGGPISATLALGVSPNHEPINPTKTFSPDAQVIYVAFRASQVQPGSRLKAVWSAVDVGATAPPNSQFADSTIVLPGPAPGNFRFSRGSEPWAVGKYKVDLYLNDQLVVTLPYRITR